METLKNGLDRALKYLLVFLMSILTIDVLWQVLARFLRISSSWTNELAGFLLIWVALLGAAYVSSGNAHLGLELLPNALSGAKRKTLKFFTHLLIIAFSLTVLVAGGINLIKITLVSEQVSSALEVPLGYVYSVIPLAGILIAFYSVYHMVAYDKEEAKKQEEEGSVS